MHWKDCVFQTYFGQLVNEREISRTVLAILMTVQYDILELAEGLDK